MGIVRIPLGSNKYPGRFALVDEEDYPTVSQHHWTVRHCAHTEYATRNVKGDDGKIRQLAMHRFILGARDGFEVDHADGNGLNNTRGNLRECSRQQNCQNMGLRRDNSAGYKGVIFDRPAGKWRTDLRGDFVGYFDDPITAARAYDTVARDAFGEYARLNFPDDKPMPLPPRITLREFSANEDTVILRMRSEKQSWANIGRLLGRHGSVVYKRHRLLSGKG